MIPRTAQANEHNDDASCRTGNLNSCYSTNGGKSQSFTSLQKLGSCLALLVCSVSATLCAEASKSREGKYPYNSFMIPCTVEGMKLCASVVLLASSWISGDVKAISFRPLKFACFALPALCYFTSNNCMFYIIQELGPTTFQVTNNLKVMATGFFMRVFLGKKLTWLRWKALALLVLGSCVTQLCTDNSGELKTSTFGYTLVLLNSLSAGAGGVISELLLKGKHDSVVDPIHWQNIQLYFFGLALGLMSSWSKIADTGGFDGFNLWAYLTVFSLTLSGLLVSFIIKYLDNIAKCFVAAVAIVCVAVVHGAVENEAPRMNLVIGIVLTCLALEQYNLPQ